MGANVDVSSLVVRYGEALWPFRLDLDNGSACIELHGALYEIGALTWRAKMRLARFAHMDQAFIQGRFLEACIRTPKILPAKKRDEAVLLALANWINSSELPLDQNRLAAVTVDVCRALRVGPMEFAELPASELEMLWLNLDQRSAESEVTESSFSERPSQTFDRVRAPEPHFDTKIVIVPDQTHSSDLAESDLNEYDEPATAVEAVADEQIVNEQVADEQIVNRQVADEQIVNEQIANEQIVNEQIADEQIVNEQITDEQIVNEQIASNRKSTAPDRNARARFRVLVDQPPVKTPGKSANVTARLPLKRSRQATQPQVEAVGPKEFSPSAPARDAGATPRFRVLVDKPPVKSPGKTDNATVRLPLKQSREATQSVETALSQNSEITVEHSQSRNAVNEIYPTLPRYGTDVTQVRDADRSELSTSPSLTRISALPQKSRSLSQTTVGAALRGRPLIENTRTRETGGHGGPPLQLLSTIPMTFEASPQISPKFAESDETESAPQSESLEWMLDEFCERLAEAAADLGILEEV